MSQINQQFEIPSLKIKELLKLYKEKKYDQIIKNYKKLKDLYIESYFLIYIIASTYEKLNEVNLAIIFYKKALLLKADDPNIIIHLFSYLEL